MATLFKHAAKVQAGSIAWLNECIERGRHGVFAELTTLTPGLAGELLRRNVDNRTIRPVKLAQYEQDIVNGDWTTNGEPIIISDSGILIDGQHRSLATVNSNRSIPVLMVFGVPHAARTTIDQGAARTASDYLSMDGIKNAAVVAGAGRMLIAYWAGDGSLIGSANRTTNAEIMARFKNDDGMHQSAAFAMHRYGSAKKLIGPSLVTFCHYLMADIEEEDANTFLDQVCVGENIRRKDPAFAVREALLRDRVTRIEKVTFVFHGWNAFRRGGSLKLVKATKTLPALI